MKTTSIDAVTVSKLRSLAIEARKFPNADREESGWGKSPVDPMNLLAPFPRLRLKPGYVLRAYVLQAGGNGNGVIWAVPENLPFPEPYAAIDPSQIVPNPPGWPAFLSHPPLIPGCLPDLMAAVHGDGSPESYLHASLFAREAAEFGAKWHGCDWTTHKILGDDTWVHPPTILKGMEIPHLNSWKWVKNPPIKWDPTVTEEGDTVTVRFYTYTELEVERLVSHIDTYKLNHYEFQRHTEEIATGRGGYMF